MNDPGVPDRTATRTTVTTHQEYNVKRYIIIACVLALAAGCGSPNTSYQTTVEVSVSVTDLEPGFIEEFITTTGSVVATGDVSVTTQVEGLYHPATNAATDRPYAFGDRVRKDDVLVTLENPDEENSIRMESVKLSLDNTQRNYEQQKVLYDKGGVTLSELKDAERSLVDSKYSYESALLREKRMTVIAPITGVIVDMPAYTPGVRVASGSEVARIMDYSTLTLDVNIPERRLGEVVVRQEVRVSNYSIPDRVLSGAVTQVSPAVNPDTRTFKAVVSVRNPDLILRPGMFVKADIVVQRHENVIVIPKGGLSTRRNRNSVFVVERGFAAERMVTTGLENADHVEIAQGLQTGDRLVTSGFETLRQGSQVKIVQ